MIDTFTKEQFEAALPRSLTTGAILWKSEGLIQGEWCYSIRIDDKTKVLIRSSVKEGGESAEIGEDSIRTFLVTTDNKFLGSKVSKWTTRRPGWEERMRENCRSLIRLRRRAGDNKEGKPHLIRRVKKDGANLGRFFAFDPEDPKFFKWLT